MNPPNEEHAAPTRLYLKRREERRIRRGHPWVFSNEVDVARSPLTALAPGDPVHLFTHGGRMIASGYANPRTLICARLLGERPEDLLGADLIARRIASAAALRERLIGTPFHRLVHGESDGLPGLVVDRFGDTVCVQIGTAGMERWRDMIVEILREQHGARTVVMRNDTASRRLEGLDETVEVIAGPAPGRIEVHEGDARFSVDPLAGQKTGWFFDQASNRERVRAYANGARVLDCFSYAGGWAVQAALGGAREVVCVDSSQAALSDALGNAQRNGVAERVRVQRGDAFDALKAFDTAGERFDVVVLDPPAFVRRRKDLESGTEAYRRLNRIAMRLVEPGGFLVSCSCSSPVEAGTLADTVRAGAARLGRTVQLLEQRGAGPDHPVRPGFAESEYLKAQYFRLVD